jgi:fructan beta-fructosidase
MTLPRELKLRRDENGYTLLQNPVREVETLRGASHDLKNFASDGCELLGAWNVSTHNARCGFRVLSGDGEETLIGYENGAIFLDRTRAGQSDFNAHFARRYEMPLSQNGEIKLRVFVDRNGVEVFANDGEAMLSALVFPANEKLQIEAWSENAELWEARAFELRDAKMENAACCDPQ